MCAFVCSVDAYAVSELRPPDLPILYTYSKYKSCLLDPHAYVYARIDTCIHKMHREI